jgi:AcrR family transcriptional regulator
MSLVQSNNDDVALWQDELVSAEDTLPLPTLVGGIPPPPSSQLDPYLDAAAKCFARHGIKRASVQDVARELGVNRTTVYRQIGNVDDMVRLLLARELHRFVAEVPLEIRPDRGPAAVVALLAAVVRHARSHPVLVKVLRDEPELIGPFLVAELPALINRVAAEIVPLLKWAMEQGALADRDPARLADWLVRAAVTLVVAPPADDLEEFLTDLLLPTLVPAGPVGRRSGRKR